MRVITPHATDFSMPSIILHSSTRPCISFDTLIIYSYSLKVVQRSAAIPDPRVDKRKAHAHNAFLEGVAREREYARSLCTLRERDFDTRCEYAFCEREIESETAHVYADQFLSHSALHN